MTSEEKLAALDASYNALRSAWLEADTGATALSMTIDSMMNEFDYGNEDWKQELFLRHCKGYFSILLEIAAALEAAAAALDVAADGADKAVIRWHREAKGAGN